MAALELAHETDGGSDWTCYVIWLIVQSPSNGHFHEALGATGFCYLDYCCGFVAAAAGIVDSEAC